MLVGRLGLAAAWPPTSRLGFPTHEDEEVNYTRSDEIPADNYLRCNP